MFDPEWLRSSRILGLLVAGFLAACVSQAPRRGATGDTGGSGAEEETGGTAGKKTGGSGGATGGAGGAAKPDASVSGTGGASSGGADAGPVRDLGPDLPFSQIAGFAICVVCHGPEGAGTANGPEIQHPVIDFSTWVVRNGRMHPNYKEPMPKSTPDMLPDDQLQGIFAFLAKPPKPTTGEGLYKDYCLNCHGADAKGGVTMRPIDAEPMAAHTMHIRSGTHPGEFANRREYMPKWTAAELTDAEIRLIFMYVAGL